MRESGGPRPSARRARRLLDPRKRRALVAAGLRSDDDQGEGSAGALPFVILQTEYREQGEDGIDGAGHDWQKPFEQMRHHDSRLLGSLPCLW